MVCTKILISFKPVSTSQAVLVVVPEKPSKRGYLTQVIKALYRYCLSIQIPLLNATGTPRDKCWCHRHSERKKQHPLDNTQGFPAQNETLILTSSRSPRLQNYMKYATGKWIHLFKNIFMTTFSCQIMKEILFLCQHTLRWEDEGKKAKINEGSILT